MGVELPKTIHRYPVVGVIGSGAMGVVYKAHDPELDRDLAIKVMAPKLSERPDFDELVGLFRKEGKAAARLKHANIVTVFDFGFVEVDQPFLVMEFVTGQDLSKVLKEEGLPLERGLRVLRDVLLGLEHAHTNNVIHRDIKPANILLCEGDVTKIADFGLARIVNPDATGTGGAVGTPRYMSPEQVRGEVVDPRTDLFSVGAILYEIVTGKKAFPADHLQAIFQAVLNDDPDFGSLDSRIRPVVQRAMAKSRDARFQTAREFLDEIDHLIAALGTAAPSPPRVSGDALGTLPIPTPPAELVERSNSSATAADQPTVSDSARFWGRRIVSYMRRTPPLLILLHTGAPVLALFFGAKLLQIDEVTIGGKALGFNQVINFGGGGLWLWMFIAFFTAEFVQSVPESIKELYKRQMVRRYSDLEPAGTTLLLTRWEHIFRRVAPWFVVAALIASFIALSEWATFVAYPLAMNDGMAGPGQERDWTIAVLFNPEYAYGSRFLNGAFAFFVWCIVALSASTILFLITALGVTIFLFSELETGRRGLCLVPDVHSADKRRGFEVLRKPVESGLLAASFCYLWGLTFRLSDLYLNEGVQASGSEYVLDLFRSSFSALIACGTGSECVPGLLALVSIAEFRFTGFFAFFGSVVLLAPAFYLPVFVLRHVAKSGRDLLRRHLEGTAEGAKYIARLDKMTFFPLTYLTPTTLLVVILTSMVAVVFFRFAPILIVAWVIVLLVTVTKNLLRGSNAPTLPDV